MTAILLDTGPLVALFDKNEQHHAWAVGVWASLHSPLLTCDAVLVEASYLLRRLPGGRQMPLDQIGRTLTLAFDFSAEHARVRQLMAKYADVPMAVADACLVRMAEMHEGATILTFDRDFQAYRANGRQNLRLIAPWQ